MIHLATIKLLREWARWGEANHIGYPSMSPMFGVRALKTPLFGIGHIPPDVLRVEEAVCRLDFAERDVLIQRYQRHRSFVQIGYRIGRSADTAKRRLQAAEHAVHHEMRQNPCQNAATSLYSRADSKTVTQRSRIRKVAAFCI